MQLCNEPNCTRNSEVTCYACNLEFCTNHVSVVYDVNDEPLLICDTCKEEGERESEDLKSTGLL